MLTGAFLCLPFGVHARGRQPQAPAAILSFNITYENRSKGFSLVTHDIIK